LHSSTLSAQRKKAKIRKRWTKHPASVFRQGEAEDFKERAVSQKTTLSVGFFNLKITYSTDSPWFGIAYRIRRRHISIL